MHIGRIGYFAPASLAESGTTKSLKNSSSETSLRFDDAFIPKTSKWGKKPECVDEFDENPKCCVSGYDIEAVLEQAYEDGLEDHPGVMAIENRPCITAMDLETLADELAIMAPEEEKSSDDLPTTNIPGAPHDLDLSVNPVMEPDDNVVNYCIKLTHDVIAKSYGALKSIPQKKALSINFEAVWDYCTEMTLSRYDLKSIMKNEAYDKNKPYSSGYD